MKDGGRSGTTIPGGKPLKRHRIFPVVLLVLAGVLIVIFVLAAVHNKETENLIYRDSLSLTAATVDGQVLTLRDLAFYIAYQELKVDEQARIYDPDHPSNYWNAHTNGEFLRVTARKAAVDMMIHDYVYSREAATKGIALDPEEEAMCDSSAYDFWSDLTENQREALGIPEEQVYTVCRQIGLAEKYLMELSEENDRDLAVYETGGKAWEEKRDAMDIQTNEQVLKRIQMGQIILGLE